jgi:general secretion pathway protein I
MKSPFSFANKTHTQGFTLIEVLVAMMILSGAIMVMANAWSGNFARIRNARVNNTMAALLERKMTEYEIRVKEKNVDDVPEEETGEFGVQFPGYRWEMKTQAFEMPNITGALSAREGGVDEMTMMIVKTTSDYMKEAVRELAVTVFYKARNGNEIRHTATTYLVDYTKEIPLPPLPGMGAQSGAGSPGGAGAATGAAPAIGK